MISSAARSFVRSTTSTVTTTTFGRTSVGVSRSLATLGNSYQQHQPRPSSNPFYPLQAKTATSSVNVSNQCPLVGIFQQHAAAPVFHGFAATPQPPPQQLQLQSNHPIDILESILSPPVMLMNVASTTETMQDPPLYQQQTDDVMEMKRNRNNRPAKKANKGKRPCNRNARRAKLIKIGRRRRS